MHFLFAFCFVLLSLLYTLDWMKTIYRRKLNESWFVRWKIMLPSEVKLKEMKKKNKNRKFYTWYEEFASYHRNQNIYYFFILFCHSLTMLDSCRVCLFYKFYARLNISSKYFCFMQKISKWNLFLKI